MRAHEAVRDFDLPPCPDVRQLSWFRPLTVQVVGEVPAGDVLLRRVVDDLLGSFRRQGHQVVESATGGVDLALACAQIPDGPEPLIERIAEREVPLLFALMQQFGLERRPDHLVTLVSVSDRIGELAHVDAVETARFAMARIGSPKLVFVSGDRVTGELREATYCTLEGGHPSDGTDVVDRLRDRLVTAACAREVGGAYQFVEGRLSAEQWAATQVPDALVVAGHRMGVLGLLPQPRSVSDYVSSKTAAFYQRFLGIKGFSEGMLFAWDPGLQALLVTASGSWEVDKRKLERSEVAVIAGLGDDGRLEVLVPEGVTPKGPSVEAWEMWHLLQAVRRVPVRQGDDGSWVAEPSGTVTVPLIRAGFHAHVGTHATDVSVIESVGANRSALPYGFGCGTDLMREVGLDVAVRSQALNDVADPRHYVRWPMLYHGETAVELWKPGQPNRPLDGLLDAYDPDGAASVSWHADHVHQPD